MAMCLKTVHIGKFREIMHLYLSFFWKMVYDMQDCDIVNVEKDR